MVHSELTDHPRMDLEALYRSIYGIRKELDIKQQPGYARTPSRRRNKEKLTQLHGYLSERYHENQDPGFLHPYNLSFAERKRMASIKEEYGQGGQGRTAVFTSEEPYHLYRLATIRDILNGGYDSIDPYLQSADVKEVYNQLMQRTDDGEKWLSLAEALHCVGLYRNLCGTSWWTDFTIEKTDVISASLHLGLPLPDPYCVVMQCRTDAVCAHIPNVLDAFTNLVFFPVGCSSNWSSGMTICLEDIEEIKLGQTEYCIEPLDVNRIHIVPVPAMPFRNERNLDPFNHPLDVRMLHRSLPTLVRFYQSHL